MDTEAAGCGNQAEGLGGTEIPPGIRGSGVLPSRDQHLGVPAGRGKLRPRWGRPIALSVGSLGGHSKDQGSAVPTEGWTVPQGWPRQARVATGVLQWPQGLDPAGLQRSLLFPHPCPGSRRQDFLLVM